MQVQSWYLYARSARIKLEGIIYVSISDRVFFCFWRTLSNNAYMLAVHEFANAFDKSCSYFVTAL